MIVVGAVLMGIGFIVLSTIESIWAFYVGMLIVAGGSSATMGVPRSWAIVQWFRRLRGRAMGIGNIGGTFAGPLVMIIAWILAEYGWRTAFVVLGVGTILVCVPLGAVYRARPEEYGLLPDGDKYPPTDGPTDDGRGDGTPGSEVPQEESYTTRQALKTSAFWILAGLFAIQQFGQGAITVHLIAYLEGPDVGFSSPEAASVLGFFTVLSIFGRLGGGWAMDRFGARTTMAVLLGLMVVGYFVLVNMTAYWLVPIYAFVYGTGFGGLMTGRNVIIGSFFGRDSFGAISAIIHSATVPVGIFAPVFLGWVVDLTGSYRPGIWAIIVVSAIGVPLTLLARPPQREERQTRVSP